MSFKHIAHVRDHSKTKGPTRLLLLTIATRTDDDGFAYPSLSCLAKDTGMTIRSVRRALAQIPADEIAITSQSGKIEHFWLYEARELRWALAGFETLVDAQARNVLSQRSAWRPYDARSHAPTCPRIESLALGDAQDAGAKDSFVAQTVEASV